MNIFIEKIDRIILFFVVYTITFVIFFGTLSYTIPFVIAFLFAYMLQNPTKYLIKKFKLKNYTASLITTILFYTLITALLTWIIFLLGSESIQLGKSAQVYVSQNTDFIHNFFNTLKKYYTSLDPIIVSTIENNISSYTSKTLGLTVTISSKLVSSFLSFLSSIPYIVMIILFSMLSTYFFTRDISSAKDKFLNIIPNNKTDRLFLIFTEAKKMISKYLLSYLLVIGITFIETLIGFLVFKIKYSLILSLLAAICDILPIIGIGVVYVPVIITCILAKNYFAALGLIILYIIVSIFRQIIEPKIVSSTLGIHPVAVLAALFIGLQANGLSGMVFCIFLVVFYNILRNLKIL